MKISYFLIMMMAAVVLTATAAVSFAAGNSTMTITATVLSKSNCRFITATSTLAFGSLNPANSSDVTVNSTVSFRCGGSAPLATFSISQDDGLYETGPGANRMRNTTVLTEYLPYTLTLNPFSGTVPKNVVQTLTVSGLVKASDYQQAYVGNFSDTVVLSIAP